MPQGLQSGQQLPICAGRLSRPTWAAAFSGGGPVPCPPPPPGGHAGQPWWELSSPRRGQFSESDWTSLTPAFPVTRLAQALLWNRVAGPAVRRGGERQSSDVGPAPLWAWWAVPLSRWQRGQGGRPCPMPVTPEQPFCRSRPRAVGGFQAKGALTPAQPPTLIMEAARSWSPRVRAQSPEPLRRRPDPGKLGNTQVAASAGPPAHHCPPEPLVTSSSPLWPVGLPGH